MKEKNKFKIAIIIVVALLLLVGIFSNNNTKTFETNNKEKQNSETIEVSAEDNKPVEEELPICDGSKIINNCEVDGVIYEVYKYYPPEEEQFHMETITTYEKKITGYCTLCNDGTFSPTCATGRGACSHHGGVARYNAPIYSEVPKTEQKKVIDKEATPERWEKIVKKSLENK